MYCKECGREIPKSSRFCPECEARTEGENYYYRPVPPIPPISPRDPEDLILGSGNGSFFRFGYDWRRDLFPLCVHTIYSLGIFRCYFPASSRNNLFH